MKWFSDFSRDVWQLRTDQMPRWKAFWYRFLRIVLLTIQGFTKTQIQQGASALTYYSLLALVPVAALAVGISRGFRLEQTLKNWVIEHFSEQSEIVNKLFAFAEASLKQAQQGIIAGVGIILLFWSVIKILRYIEIALNQIWEVKHTRTLARQFSDYLAMILICPIILIVTSSLTVYLTAKITEFGKSGPLLEEISPFIFPLLNLFPYLLTSLLFTFIYIFMPNTRVRFLSALYAGLIAGAFYQVIQWLYLSFQISVTTYNAIYGTFAALPLFLIWVHLSWVIVLLGAKISFAFQNVDAFEFVTEDFSLSHKFKNILCLRICHYCIQKFCAGEPPPPPIDISNQLSIPLVLTGQLLYELSEASILSEVKRDEDLESGFQPAKSVDQLTIKSILDMIDERGERIPLPPSKELEVIQKSLETFSQEINRSDANLLVKNI